MIQTQAHCETFDITNVKYVHRIVVGSVDPRSVLTEAQYQEKMDLINRCLNESPKGRLIGMERSFSIIRVGEHQVVLESVAYHIGFTRQPYWLIEMEQQQKQSPQFQMDPEMAKQFVGA